VIAVRRGPSGPTEREAQDRARARDGWLECRPDGAHVVHGDTVSLRPLREDDLGDLLAAYDDPQARRNHGYEGRPLDDILDYSREYIAHASLDPLVADLAIVPRGHHDEVGPGVVLGHVQLVATPIGDPADLPVQLGFTVHERGRGRGVATEAVRLARRLAHEHLGVRTVWAETAPWNVGAARVMTKAGMRPRPGALRTLPDGQVVATAGFVSRARRTVGCPLLLGAAGPGVTP
jgi:RimJ/RimL family protein N-acetyltransferase